jgi:transposase InsO family protein
VHSDQGSPFTSYEWQKFLEQHNLVPSMSRRGNGWDNAVVESFFNLLKRERIRPKKYKTREERAGTCSPYGDCRQSSAGQRSKSSSSTTHSVNT